jgi:hypothetical protein
MDNEMIERVAKAILDAMDLTDGLDGTAARTYAEACIKAMREPTEKILGAIHGCYPDVPDKYASSIAKQRWEAAIDAIVND